MEPYKPVEAVMRALVYHGPGHKAVSACGTCRFCRVRRYGLRVVLSRPKE